MQRKLGKKSVNKSAKCGEEAGNYPNALHGWVRQGDIDLGLSSKIPPHTLTLNDELQQLHKSNKDLNKENKPLRQENGFLEEASAFFAASLKKSA